MKTRRATWWCPVESLRSLRNGFEKNLQWISFVLFIYNKKKVNIICYFFAGFVIFLAMQY